MRFVCLWWLLVTNWAVTLITSIFRHLLCFKYLVSIILKSFCYCSLRIVELEESFQCNGCISGEFVMKCLFIVDLYKFDVLLVYILSLPLQCWVLSKPGLVPDWNVLGFGCICFLFILTVVVSAVAWNMCLLREMLVLFQSHVNTSYRSQSHMLITAIELVCTVAGRTDGYACCYCVSDLSGDEWSLLGSAETASGVCSSS